MFLVILFSSITPQTVHFGDLPSKNEQIINKIICLYQEEEIQLCEKKKRSFQNYNRKNYIKFILQTKWNSIQLCKKFFFILEKRRKCALEHLIWASEMWSKVFTEESYFEISDRINGRWCLRHQSNERCLETCGGAWRRSVEKIKKYLPNKEAAGDLRTMD